MSLFRSSTVRPVSFSFFWNSSSVYGLFDSVNLSSTSASLATRFILSARSIRISLLISSSRMLSFRESDSSCEGAGASAFTRVAIIFIDVGAHEISFPFTTAQTSGPGAVSFLHPAAKLQNKIARKDEDSASFKRRLNRRRRWFSSGLFHLAGADTGGADANVFTGAFDYGLDAAQIGIPAAAANVMSVADDIAEARFLAAKFTCECH